MSEINTEPQSHDGVYNINLDTKFQHLELIDVPSVVAACTEKWQNYTLTQVNDSVVRIGIVEGEFHWHKHDNDDEFFFVLEGQLLIDLEDRTIELNPNQGTTITKRESCTGHGAPKKRSC